MGPSSYSEDGQGINIIKQGWDARSVQHTPINNKDRNCRIILIDTDKAFDQVQHALMIKVLEKLG